jgi:hypothetical protein
MGESEAEKRSNQRPFPRFTKTNLARQSRDGSALICRVPVESEIAPREIAILNRHGMKHLHPQSAPIISSPLPCARHNLSS